jgi:hypothetical protein
LGSGRSELHVGSGLLAEPNAHGQHLGHHVKDEVVSPDRFENEFALWVASWMRSPHLAVSGICVMVMVTPPYDVYIEDDEEAPMP